jgi:hypothetical protein
MRTVTVLLVCLGVALPSAPGIAICLGGDGDSDLTGAGHASCARAEPGGCERGAAVCESDRALESVDEFRDCRDVILSRDFATSPPKPASEKHRSQHPLSDAVGVTACRGDHDAVLDVLVASAVACRVTALRSLSTVVLRL